MQTYQVEIEDKETGARRVVEIVAEHPVAAKSKAETQYHGFRALYVVA